MVINENTKVMARFHTAANNRGLNIYNPYFEAAGENALYVLFHNPDPTPLIAGLKNLNMWGAIPAGFEKDSRLMDLVDELDPVSEVIQKAGILVQRNGKVKGYYQGGYGLLDSITTKIDITNKKIVILGAGQVVESLLLVMQMLGNKPGSIEIYNRTVAKAERLAEKYKSVKKVGTFAELETSSGDIFINATGIGSPWNKSEDYQFTESFISKFKFVADVTFVPLEPQLIQVANKLGIDNSPGWRMFLYQGKMCLEKILDIEVDTTLLADFIIKDFASNWS